MELTYLFFLSSGLFLGWSLGANDASNIFGTAVGSKMVKFKTAAIISSIFVILGAVYGGQGGTETLGALGAVNALGGAFMVALSAAITVYWMAKIGMAVSTSQAIVGGIIGWNLFAGKSTDISVLTKICSTWILCPLLTGVVAVLLYWTLKAIIRKSNLHLLRQDYYIRIGLIVAGALCAYSLGANNIANIIGVFADSSPFKPVNIGKYIHFSGLQILFLLGGISISAGIVTYSKKVILTVGNSLMKMTPLIALVVVLAQALTLFLFSSKELQQFLLTHHLPAFPLVPVSSTQAVIGAILGLGLLKGGRGVNWTITLKLMLGWVSTPLIAMAICFISLFFLQNVFNMTVFLP
ncbi:MAG: inorganic phosphate transporter [Alphaproteobacteria bacterium]|nr:inorganic phosphate transporter [Alphaproteobacteria bacterium]